MQLHYLAVIIVKSPVLRALRLQSFLCIIKWSLWTIQVLLIAVKYLLSFFLVPSIYSFCIFIKNKLIKHGVSSWKQRVRRLCHADILKKQYVSWFKYSSWSFLKYCHLRRKWRKLTFLVEHFVFEEYYLCFYKYSFFTYMFIIYLFFKIEQLLLLSADSLGLRPDIVC